MHMWVYKEVRYDKLTQVEGIPARVRQHQWEASMGKPIHDVTTGSLICRYSRDVIRMRVTSEFALPEKRPRRAVPAHYQQPTAAGHGDSLARTHTRSPVSGSTPAAPPWLPPLGSRLMCHKTLASAGLNQILGLPGSLTRYPASSCSPPGSCKGD